jgi:hypothetical protein
MRASGEAYRPAPAPSAKGFDLLRAGLAAAILMLLATIPGQAAEYGTGPWIKGYSDIFAGIIPPVSGLYVRNDDYAYGGTADATVFDGRVQIGVEENFIADILAVTYVTPIKIFGGTYAMAVAPSVVVMDVNVGVGIPAITLPVGVTVGPFNPQFGDSELALGDTAFAPLVLGWNAGKFSWNFALFGFAPTGDYSTRQLANTSLNHWAIMPRLAGTYFDPKTGWQISGAFVYSVNWENPATDYETGNIVNIEGAITKNFGPIGLGAVGYGMIQTTGDSGRGARLGSFESRVFGVGPILTLTLGGTTPTPLTFLVKWYHEFDAEHTFEGDVVDGAFTFKF